MFGFDIDASLKYIHLEVQRIIFLNAMGDGRAIYNNAENEEWMFD
jgi:hypothetical protein